MGKKLITLLIVLMVVAASIFANGENEEGAAGSSENIVIKLAHDNNVSTPAQEAFEEFKKVCSEKSDGRIDVQIFPGGQLGSVQDTFEQARRGDIQMSVAATSLLTQTIPEFMVWDSYYMFDDAAHAHRVLDGKAGVELMKYLEPMNLYGLGYMEIGFRNFSNSRNPIVNPEDVEGLKIRGWSPMQIKAWEAVGCSLSNLSWSEVFTSLQQHLIDGQECATASFYSAKFYEAQKYWSLTQHIYTNFLWYVNKDFMDNLSPEDQKIIRDAAKVAIDLDRELIVKAENETLDLLPGLGIEVNEVPLETRHILGEKMNNAIQDSIISKCGDSVYNLVMTEIENERK